MVVHLTGNVHLVRGIYKRFVIFLYKLKRSAFQGYQNFVVEASATSERMSRK